MNKLSFTFHCIKVILGVILSYYIFMSLIEWQWNIKLWGIIPQLLFMITGIGMFVSCAVLWFKAIAKMEN